MGGHLRDYQLQAIESWAEAGHASILEMATGTGKTFTAVSAALQVVSKLRAQRSSCVILVVCPYLHLVDQWAQYFSQRGLMPVEACETQARWLSQASQQLSQASLLEGSLVILITTQATFMTRAFQGLFRDFPGQTIFIADEVHNLGTAKSAALLPKFARYRLGLSATPDRWLDPAGTKRLVDYFGPVSYKLDIKTAIKLGCLSKYRYHPRVAPLSEMETEAFAELSVKLAQILAGRSLFDLNEDETRRAGAILRARAALLGDAESKWESVRKDLVAHANQPGQLVYCSEGTSPNHPDNRQIDRVRLMISSLRIGLPAIYEATTPRKTRQEYVQKFTQGTITHLLSMRCLDEGVDIPMAATAYFIASSANPRQFVQRRGRVLRTHDSKTTADIYDYFLVPKMSGSDSRLEIERAIGKRELQRTMEFIDACENKEEALKAIKPLRDFYEESTNDAKHIR